MLCVTSDTKYHFCSERTCILLWVQVYLGDCRCRDGGSWGTLTLPDFLPQTAAPSAGGPVAWEDRNFQTGGVVGKKWRPWSDWVETQNHVWAGPGSLRIAFLVLLLAAVHLSWLVEEHFKHYVSLFSRVKETETRFVDCLTDLTVKFHKLHIQNTYWWQLALSLSNQGWNKIFGESNCSNNKALGSKTDLTFMYCFLWGKATCVIYYRSLPNFGLELHDIFPQKKSKCINLFKNVQTRIILPPTISMGFFWL